MCVCVCVCATQQIPAMLSLLPRTVDLKSEFMLVCMHACVYDVRMYVCMYVCMGQLMIEVLINLRLVHVFVCTRFA